jgi:hypothetical protein
MNVAYPVEPGRRVRHSGSELSAPPPHRPRPQWWKVEVAAREEASSIITSGKIFNTSNHTNAFVLFKENTVNIQYSEKQQ